MLEAYNGGLYKSNLRRYAALLINITPNISVICVVAIFYSRLA